MWVIYFSSTFDLSENFPPALEIVQKKIWRFSFFFFWKIEPRCHQPGHIWANFASEHPHVAQKDTQSRLLYSIMTTIQRRNAAVDCVTFWAKLGQVKISIQTKGKQHGRQVVRWEETWGQYVESKINVFFLPRENYLQPCVSWLPQSRLCFADTIDTK